MVTQHSPLAEPHGSQCEPRKARGQQNTNDFAQMKVMACHTSSFSFYLKAEEDADKDFAVLLNAL